MWIKREEQRLKNSLYAAYMQTLSELIYVGYILNKKIKSAHNKDRRIFFPLK